MVGGRLLSLENAVKSSRYSLWVQWEKGQLGSDVSVKQNVFPSNFLFICVSNLSLLWKYSEAPVVFLVNGETTQILDVVHKTPTADLIGILLR